MAETAIEWATDVWNPTTGCDRVSPGCAHCYALDLAARLKRMGQPKYQRDGDPKTSGPGFGVTLHPDALDLPLRQKRPRTYFVNSMSDLFHEDIPDEYIERIFGVMACTQRHTFQVLTKRPERMAALITGDFHERVARAAWEHADQLDLTLSYRFPLPNVWLGVSIENRRFVDRADLLRETPAAVRFVSAEPLLGPLAYDARGQMGPEMATRCVPCFSGSGDPLAPQLDLAGIDWLIVGGESGPKHRPIRAEWVRDLRDATRWPCNCCRIPRGTHAPECDSHGGDTAFFFKQWGGRTPKAGGRELDGRTWDEMPAQAPEDTTEGAAIEGED